MSELYEDGSGQWSSSQTQKKVPEETTRSGQAEVVHGQKATVSNSTDHRSGHVDKSHDDLQPPKCGEQQAPCNLPKKQNPFV